MKILDTGTLAEIIGPRQNGDTTAFYVDYQKSSGFHVRRGTPAQWAVRAKPDSSCGFVEF